MPGQIQRITRQQRVQIGVDQRHGLLLQLQPVLHLGVLGLGLAHAVGADGGIVEQRLFDGQARTAAEVAVVDALLSGRRAVVILGLAGAVAQVVDRGLWQQCGASDVAGVTPGGERGAGRAHLRVVEQHALIGLRQVERARLAGAHRLGRRRRGGSGRSGRLRQHRRERQFRLRMGGRHGIGRERHHNRGDGDQVPAFAG